MKANARQILSEHWQIWKSILFVEEGVCVVTIIAEDIKKGDAFAIPSEIKHQIKANTDFKGVHFMPIKIKF